MSLRWKTILGVAAIESVLLILLVSLTLGQMQQSNSDALEKRASTVATLFATTSKDATLSYDLASLESFVREVMKNPDLRYARVLSSQGDILAAAGSIAHLPGQFAPDESLETVKDGVFDSTAIIAEAGVIYGQVQIGIDTGRIVSDLAELKQWSYSLVTLELVLVALFSWFLGTYLTHQLHELRQAARKISINELDVNLPVRSKDEIGEVATAFNAMVVNLKSSRKKQVLYEQELRSLNETLEKRVAERTSQLEESVHNLQVAKTDLEHQTAERQKIEAEMRHAQKMEALGQLSAGVAHEINTPVQYIGDSMHYLRDAFSDFTEFSDQLKELAVDSEMSDKEKGTKILDLEEQLDTKYLVESTPAAIERAVEGVERVTEIVTAMKSFGSGRNIERGLSDVNQVISQALIVTRHEYKFCATASSVLADNLPRINCDSAELTQVLMLLIVNAAQAITDRHGDGDKGRIEVKTLNNQNEEIQIAISDNGCGMTAELQERIFEPFFTTRDLGEGSGKGLTIAWDSVVVGHGGKILVQSAPNEGSTFTVCLPTKPSKFRNFLTSDQDAISLTI